MSLKNAQNRIMVIGLDCGTLDLIKPWAEAGYLPNLARLVDQGCHGILESTIPTISPAAWTSFMTGKNPGKHGIYDFMRRREDTYHMQVIRNDLVAQGTIFRLISEAGRRVGVINVPMTYPPEPVNGFMISGLGAPDNDRYTYPPDLVQDIKAQGYTVNNTVPFSPEQPDIFLRYLKEETDKRAAIILQKLSEEPWDFFMTVFRDIDTIEAYYWHYMDQTHPLYDPAEGEKYGQAILEYHQQVDDIIGQMIERFGPDGNVIVMSDHGGGPLHKEVYVNNWLAQKGFLTFKSRKEGQDWYRSILRNLGLTRENLQQLLGWNTIERLKSFLPAAANTWFPWQHPNLVDLVDWSQTKAYSFGHIGQIFINLKGREPQGIVELGEDYERTVSEIMAALRELTDPETGEHVATGIYTKSDIYHGSQTEHAPDINVIFCDMRYLVHIGMEFAYQDVFGPIVHHETGTHRLDGMLIAQGPLFEQGKMLDRASICDLAPTLLYLLGLPIPEDVDGQIVTEMIVPAYQIGHQVEYCPSLTGEFTLAAWTEEEERAVTEHLKGLGYLE